ncbi:hypothetical protein, partial [Pseudomonas syringae group genomosp. 3]|uniref:hypothetical protein n=1 Tax=Pseudomonas syringae group genomosp. 3 TaxID=251701 RepID=UPI001F1A91F0
APSDGFDGLSGHFFVCCQYKTKRPEQVGAFAWAFISVFSHSLIRAFLLHLKYLNMTPLDCRLVVLV